MKNIAITAAVAMLLIGSIYWAVSTSSKNYDVKQEKAGVHKIEHGRDGSRIYEIEFDGHHYIVVETFRGIGVTKK